MYLTYISTIYLTCVIRMTHLTAASASASPTSDSGTGVMPLEFLASDAVAELAHTGKAAKLLALVVQQLAASETEVAYLHCGLRGPDRDAKRPHFE